MIAHVRLPPRRKRPFGRVGSFQRSAIHTLLCVGMFLDLWTVLFSQLFCKVPVLKALSAKKPSKSHLRTSQTTLLIMGRAARPSTLRPLSRPPPRSHQHPRGRRLPIPRAPLHLGRRGRARQPPRLLRHRRLLRRGHLKPLPHRVRRQGYVFPSFRWRV